ncbi:MAG: hypothetical protein OEX77_07490 [Candidatus Bathyarchaeota archaeon]|nr:hypothetical protein [Candidatus Bathyarchaeota archaeon]MDH5732969.1 hypothetical protein [Candidatus Bathyarchaeota archaeon]
MKFKLYVLLFCVIVFTLTAIGLAIVYTGGLALTFWSIFAYIIALAGTYAFLVQPLLTGERKLSGKKIVLLTLGVTIMGAIVTHSVWTVISPQWLFSVTTDKSTYSLGEDVKVTVSLKNLGFITHSFKSRVSDPIVIGIGTDLSQVWYSPFHKNTTEFSIEPGQNLERTFVWNQTIRNPPDVGERVGQGVYYIEAFIPDVSPNGFIGVDNIFFTWTSINITSI